MRQVMKNCVHQTKVRIGIFKSAIQIRYKLENSGLQAMMIVRSSKAEIIRFELVKKQDSKD